MKQPKIFIVGTMKGGTTILYDYICEHPLVQAGSQKEIHYFSLHQNETLDWYTEHFSEVDEQCVSIDASPTYFDMAYTPDIPSYIKSTIPDAQAVLIVREPVGRAISHFVHMKKINSISVLSAITADDFFSRDFMGAFNQPTGIDYYLQQVLSFSLYYKKYLVYRDVFGESLLVLTNSQLRQYPHQTMGEIFYFLGLPKYASNLFGVTRYSTGSSQYLLSESNVKKLRNFLLPDFTALCDAADLDATLEIGG